MLRRDRSEVEALQHRLEVAERDRDHLRDALRIAEADHRVTTAELAEARARAEGAQEFMSEEVARMREHVDGLVAHIVKLTTPQQITAVPTVFAPLDEDAEDAAWQAQHDPNFDPNSPEVRGIVEAAGLTHLLERTDALSADVRVAE